jgi:Dolichyl-phosphate-mannose-protein mannosyltransferase
LRANDFKASFPAAAPQRAVLGLKPDALFAITLAAGAAVYFTGLGANSLGATEAYSAWAAAMPSAAAIAAIPIHLEPAKFLLYYIALHYYTLLFGASEFSVRSFSAIWGLIALGLVYAAGRSMFSREVGAAAALLWAFNPLIVIFSHTARMYAMFVAVALAHLVLLWRIRRKPDWAATLECGVMGAAAIYTHLAGLALIGADVAMLVRDWARGRAAKAPWIALGIVLVLFAPYLPIFIAQSRMLVYGHWLDWLGTPRHYSLAAKAVTVALCAVLGLAFVFGRPIEADPQEPLRWSLAWAILPAAAFIAGSIVIRPMAHIRYLLPCFAIGTLALAGALEKLNSRWRNLSVAALAVAMVVLLPWIRTKGEPWRQIARAVAAGSPRDPVFFERGFAAFGPTADVPNPGFPNGFFSVPFDHYFRGSNPRVTVPGFDPKAARKTIAQMSAAAGGGWLVTWKREPGVRRELPDSAAFRVVKELHGPGVTLYRIAPLKPPPP